jgi:NAD(P)-dependent dehydrogenase (short-subunit alcohol dehydrogenase family)
VEKVLILGGRRGFGAAVAEKWSSRFPDGELALSSRREFSSPHQTLRCDFNSDADVEKLLQFVEAWRPTRLFCFVGGGPFGPFEKKDFKDHLWAWKVSFQTPARLLHAYLNLCPGAQAILTGSAIAEEQPDAQASSYAASKHALRGLVSSIRAESPGLDVRLFSPGYMDTDMVPANSAPRLKNAVMDPAKVAEDFMKWALDPEASWHRVCRS